MKSDLHASAKLALFFLCALSLFPASAKASISTIRSADSEIWGAAGVSLFNYQEEVNAPDIADSEHGWNPSLAAGLSYMTPGNNIYFAFEGNVTFGNANYNGSVYDNNTGYYDIPYQDKTNELITTIDGKVGKGFPLGSMVMLTPYGELGFRYWARDLGAGQNEDYQNFDILAGLMVQVAPTNKLTLTAYGAGGPTMGAQMKAELTGDTYDLGSAGMYKLGGKIGYALTQHTEIFTTLDYDAFRYIVSPTQADGSLEPTSKTEDTAVRLGFAYRFQ